MMNFNVQTAIFQLALLVFGVFRAHESLAFEFTDDLPKFENACFSGGGLNVVVKFSPVVEREKLPKNNRNSGLRWGGYQFTDAAMTYPNREFARSSTANQIWLLRDITFDNKDVLPPYVWHVVSIPRRSDDDPNSDASLVNAAYIPPRLAQIPYSQNTPQPLLTVRNLGWHRSISSLRAGNSRLPTFNRARNYNDRNWVTGIWQTLIGVNMVDKWLTASTGAIAKFSEHYLHTFYFWPIDKLKSDGPHALKEASSKRLQTTGRVFGFVLDPYGACLGFDYLDIK